jgi:hypothetical protein
MSPMITQPGRPAHPEPHPDAAARVRRDRLARASVEEMESALAFLSMIDPEAFEIAFTAVAPRVGDIPEDAAAPEDEEPTPVCRECGAPVGIFLAHGLQWQHFRGDSVTAGTQEIYDPGHPAEAAWLLLPTEDLKTSSQQPRLANAPSARPTGRWTTCEAKRFVPSPVWSSAEMTPRCQHVLDRGRLVTIRPSMT